MSVPGSIYEEAVRVHRVSHMVLESGFLEFLEDDQMELLVDAIVDADVDLYREQDAWLPDLIKTAKWFLQLNRLGLVEDSWFDMLLTAIRRQGCRLSYAFDDDEGDQWKYA